MGTLTNLFKVGKWLAGKLLGWLAGCSDYALHFGNCCLKVHNYMHMLEYLVALAPEHTQP